LKDAAHQVSRAFSGSWLGYHPRVYYEGFAAPPPDRDGNLRWRASPEPQTHIVCHDARLMPAKYVRPYSRGQKNDFRGAEAIAEAAQRPTMKFVATKSAEQLDLQALHRVRERSVSLRIGIINQIRPFLLERGVAVRQGLRLLRAELPRFSPRSAISCRGSSRPGRRLASAR
jgi:Transposase